MEYPILIINEYKFICRRKKIVKKGFSFTYRCENTTICSVFITFNNLGFPVNKTGLKHSDNC